MRTSEPVAEKPAPFRLDVTSDDPVSVKQKSKCELTDAMDAPALPCSVLRLAALSLCAGATARSVDGSRSSSTLSSIPNLAPRASSDDSTTDGPPCVADLASIDMAIACADALAAMRQELAALRVRVHELEDEAPDPARAWQATVEHLFKYLSTPDGLQPTTDGFSQPLSAAAAGAAARARQLHPKELFFVSFVG